MKSLENKLIIYDSNCKVCSSLREVVLAVTPIRESQVRAYKDLDNESLTRVRFEEFKNGMALLDLQGGKTLYGSEGVVYIFSSQYRLLDLLLRIPFFLFLFTFLYKVISYNRYIIATSKSHFQCDCYPDKVMQYRVAYIIITITLSLLLTALFGISLKKYFPDLTSGTAALQMIAIAGTGWIVQMILALLILKTEVLDYLGHLGSIMIAGLLVLLPSIVISFLVPSVPFYLPAVSVICSSALMFYLHWNRIRALQISQAWTASWFFSLQSTAFLWIYFFYLN